jgi:hypothetical protein
MTLKVPRDADPAWGLQHRVRAAIIPQVDGDSDHFRPNGPPRQCPTVGLLPVGVESSPDTN